MSSPDGEQMINMKFFTKSYKNVKLNSFLNFCEAKRRMQHLVSVKLGNKTKTMKFMSDIMLLLTIIKGYSVIVTTAL